MRQIFLKCFLWVLLLSACGRKPLLGPPSGEKLATASEQDCGFVQNSFGQRVTWKSLPVKIFIDPTMPGEYESVLRASAKKWEDAMGRALFVIERAPQGSALVRDSRNVLYWFDTWGVEEKNLQALSSLSWKNNQLVEADMKVNAKYYTYYLTTPTTVQDVHLPSLFVHEFGHLLGLKHLTSTQSTVMWPYLDFLLQREAPTEEDIANLKCAYN